MRGNGLDHIGRSLQNELEEKKKVENGNGGEMLIAHMSNYRAGQVAKKIEARGKEPAYIYNHFRGALIHVCPKEEEQHWINLGYLITYYVLDINTWKGQKVVIIQ